MTILQTVGSRFRATIHCFLQKCDSNGSATFIDCMRFALKGFCSRQCYGVYLSLLAMVYRHIWLQQQDTRYYRQHLYGQTCKNNKFLTNGLT